MRQLEKKVAALGWARQYRALQRQSAEQQAMAKAKAVSDADAALDKARQNRLAAAADWSRVVTDGERLDPMLGLLWKAEYDRRTDTESEALAEKNRADGELFDATAQYRQRSVQADRARQDHHVARTRLARKIDDLKLHNVAELLAAKRVMQ